MNIESVAAAVFFFLFFSAPTAAVGWAYFAKADKNSNMKRRILTSAYGPIISMFFVIVLFLLPDDFRFAGYINFFFWTQLLPASLIIYSLIFYPGPKKMHFLLLVVMPMWLWLIVMGALKIHGE